MAKKHKHGIRNYLFAGLLVWIPIWVTLVVITFLVDLMDGTLALLPKAYRPEQLLGYHLPGLGLLLSIIIVFVTGIVATNFFGRRLVNFGESIVSRIPLVRTIYHAVKQVMETIFSSSADAFRNVLLVEYPRKGLWSIAFQTSSGAHEIDTKVEGDLISIFIPTTPNPTSGFLIMVKREDTIKLDMTVEQALKVVISLGVMQPGNGIKE